MGLSQYKHTVSEIDEVLCSVVEKNTSLQRAEFLKKILEYNGYRVKYEQDKPKPRKGKEGEAEDTPETYTVGVTDVGFNPVLAIYGRRLKTPGNKLLTPHYWKTGEEFEGWYWEEET